MFPMAHAIGAGMLIFACQRWRAMLIELRATLDQKNEPTFPVFAFFRNALGTTTILEKT